MTGKRASDSTTRRARTAKLSVAQQRIDDAERSLVAAIATLESETRANKITVTAAVREALQQLSDARAILHALEVSDTGEIKRT